MPKLFTGRNLTYKLMLAAFVAVTPLAPSQTRVTVAVPRTTPPPTLPIPRFDKGTAEGRTYKNGSVGVEIEAPPNFEFGPPQVKGSPGTVPLLVTAGAWGVETWSPVRNGVTFHAEALAYYPAGRRSTADYIRRIVRSEQRQGFDRVPGAPSSMWGGVSFSRVDLRKPPVHMAILVKACGAQALVFIFSSSDMKNADRIIAESRLKLNTTTSRCQPAAASR